MPLLNKWNFFNVGGPGIVELAVNVLQWQEVILLNCMKVDAGDKNPFGYQSSQGPQLDLHCRPRGISIWCALRSLLV